MIIQTTSKIANIIYELDNGKINNVIVTTMITKQTLNIAKLILTNVR